MNQKWVAAWGCPISRPTRRMTEWMKDVTIRMNMFMTVSGSAVRVHFTNLFGSEDAVISHASVALCKQDSTMDATTVKDITFGGKQSVTMSAGEGVISDEISISFEAGQTLSVNLYFADMTRLSTGHSNSGAFIQKWVSRGDITHLGEMPYNETCEAESYPFIHTIDALCEEDCYAIVAFGDSITAQSWPDRLSHRLYDMGKKNVSVIRKAISGSRILQEYHCTSHIVYGPKGVDRFEREVVQAGVKKVCILHGVNDIIHPDGTLYRPWEHLPTAKDLIAGLQTYIDIAHKHGIEVYLSPILPFKGWRTYEDSREVIRREVNEWIYNEAKVEGILPFEKALQSEEDALCMKDEFDSGDHLHPSSRGAQAMADSLDEKFF